MRCMKRINDSYAIRKKAHFNYVRKQFYPKIGIPGGMEHDLMKKLKHFFIVHLLPCHKASSPLYCLPPFTTAQIL